MGRYPSGSLRFRCPQSTEGAAQMVYLELQCSIPLPPFQRVKPLSDYSFSAQ